MYVIVALGYELINVYWQELCHVFSFKVTWTTSSRVTQYFFIRNRLAEISSHATPSVCVCVCVW